jgi:hypothetical protein
VFSLISRAFDASFARVLKGSRTTLTVERARLSVFIKTVSHVTQERPWRDVVVGVRAALTAAEDAEETLSKDLAMVRYVLW